MKAKPRIPVLWSEYELKFIRDNYYSMTWKELFAAVKAINNTATVQALRHQCIRMKLAKQVQIRWSKEDTQYLVDNYRIKGDKELAIELNKFKRTFRIIDGEKVYRVFTKKHIDKKKDLLGLKRSKEEFQYIRKRNIRKGLTYAWSKEDNMYTQGRRSVAPDGTIRTWKHYNRMLKHIKVDGRFIHYHRYIWEQAYGKVLKGHKVVFKDGDTLNCSLENLECISDRELRLRNSAAINLVDEFVASCLFGHKSTRRQRKKAIQDFPELIELKRDQLLLNRQIKKVEENESN